MDSFLKCVFVRAGKHTSVHDMHPHSNVDVDSYLYITTHIHTHIYGKDIILTHEMISTVITYIDFIM